MSPEDPIQQAQSRMTPTSAMQDETARLDDIAAQLMAVQRYWNAPNRESQLTEALAASRQVWYGIQTALAEGTLPLPADVQHNLLILSVYADSKIDACRSAASADALGGLIALTHTLAGSLREWREAA
ncbi:MAG: flagellar biosynthesis regulator FlaF [Pseudomonadota bacterium]